jgi:rubredoxin
MNKYCEYVFMNESGSELCHLSNEVCPKFFKDITSNCCEKRAAANSGGYLGPIAALTDKIIKRKYEGKVNG